jgi:hypothetical protein
MRIEEFGNSLTTGSTGFHREIARVRIVSLSWVQEGGLVFLSGSSWLMCGLGLGFFEDLTLLNVLFLEESGKFDLFPVGAGVSTSRDS